MLRRKWDANRATRVDLRGNLPGEGQADEKEGSAGGNLFSQKVRLAGSYFAKAIEQNMMSTEKTLKFQGTTFLSQMMRKR